MAGVLVIADGFRGWNQHWERFGHDVTSVAMVSKGVPATAELEASSTVVIIGNVANQDQAAQLAGQLRLAIERGTRAVCLYPVVLEGSLRRIVKQIEPKLAEVEKQGAQERVTTGDESFYDYFGAFGRGRTVLADLPSEAVVLGTIDGSPAAAAAKVGSGSFYLLPFHIAELRASYNSLLSTLLSAIDSYETEDRVKLPDFLEDLRLPGEPELLSHISDLRSELAEVEDSALTLRGYRHVIGHASGDHLESLAIEILNRVFEETPYGAEDRPDKGAEDFWIVGPSGDLAIAEAKGIGGSINRPAVNQVDNHRHAHEKGVEDLPGLLIVNPFRNSDEQEKRELPVAPDVIRHAVRLNVVVMRTLDLLNLLHRKLAAQSASEDLIAALKAGGGWLQVTTGSTELVTS